MDLNDLRGVNFIIRNKDKYKIPYIIGVEAVSKGGYAGISNFQGHERAFVKIQDGCDNRCSYCKVRIVRGKAKSRDFNDIIKECRDLIENAYKEIVLTGICLGSYGRDVSGKACLSELIIELCKIKGYCRYKQRKNYANICTFLFKAETMTS
jgi:threonylcarbamoyladenosine tRNA methylthiotransferase MtaB